KPVAYRQGRAALALSLMTPATTIAATTTPAPAAAARALDASGLAYLVGIGGTGMCGAAELLRARGLLVRGSDRSPSRRTERLARAGIPVDEGPGAAPLPAETTLVVASAAIPPSHPQLAEARRRGLPVWKY